MRSIAKSALAAGASTYISSKLVPKLDTNPDVSISYTDVGVHAFKRGVISAGVNTAVYHASLEDGLKDAAVTGVTAMAHKAAGDAGVARGYEEGSTEKLAMHGIIGAGSAALGGALKGRNSDSVKRSAIAGFASGAVAEYMSGRAAKEAQEARENRELSGNGSAFSDDALSAPRESTYEHLTPLAGAVAALAAGGSAEDMHMGARIAVSAREYNYMAHAAAMASRVAGLAGGSVGGALVGTDSLTSTKSTLETSLGSASSLDGLDAGDLKWGGTISTPDQRQEIDELTKQSGYGEGLGRDLDRFTHPGYAEGYGEDLSHRIFGGAVLPGFTELGERGVLGRFIRPDRGFDTLPEHAPDMNVLFKKNEGGERSLNDELRRGRGNEPIPDIDALGAPHTQLGMKKSKKGYKYKQAREFDKNGKPIRDIDFTDHGRPFNHTNPHQHKWIENKTGGTRKRLGAEPLLD